MFKIAVDCFGKITSTFRVPSSTSYAFVYKTNYVFVFGFFFLFAFFCSKTQSTDSKEFRPFPLFHGL